MGLLKGQIRVIAVAIIRNKGRILVAPGYDEVKDSQFYRLLGSGVDYGESSIDALSREFKEELDAEIINERLLKVIENIFTFNGEPGHEICFIYEADFKDPSLYDKKEFKILDSTVEGTVVWLEINEMKDKNIFPEGVKNLL
ncbi:NUDIX hydrolase [Candidatus Falkowbacteria bacterium CG10_big_fil_rev_8_21_14_0_10_37_18]|uniref:NUDIX hydrolase n=1 Tax=Candidatus Falkowbacteria bacterium CG10_big_fil_rev_8_21_14_0_10_37_18 TaxID=1974562 RepID=A0A2H0V8K9_9BACT|nr:NUDIX hydrolase [Candidatus Falkowbacteria bacterium]PIR95412.1 MAG: NUDIX hydrolase [Candidatus Falkowbacteria bacterium CG10_big_fil_rev_8_21_14_0_10_37_18]